MGRAKNQSGLRLAGKTRRRLFEGLKRIGKPVAWAASLLTIMVALHLFLLQPFLSEKSALASERLALEAQRRALQAEREAFMADVKAATAETNSSKLRRKLQALAEGREREFIQRSERIKVLTLKLAALQNSFGARLLAQEMCDERRLAGAPATVRVHCAQQREAARPTR